MEPPPPTPTPTTTYLTDKLPVVSQVPVDADDVTDEHVEGKPSVALLYLPADRRTHSLRDLKRMSHLTGSLTVYWRFHQHRDQVLRQVVREVDGAVDEVLERFHRGV